MDFNKLKNQDTSAIAVQLKRDNMILCDVSSERAVLGGIIRYGENAYLDIADIIQEKTFTVDSNQIIYRCIALANSVWF